MIYMYVSLQRIVKTRDIHVVLSSATSICLSVRLSVRHIQDYSGGFRHVQHVRPNRGPTKRGPTKGAKNFCIREKWTTPE